MRALAPLSFPVAVWALSRAFFLVVGSLAAANIDPAIPQGDLVPPPGALSRWAVWDGAWYSAIAADGYPNVLAPASTAFFPLFPLTLRGGLALGGGAPAWGVVISTLAACAALCFLHQIAAHHFGERVARASTLGFAFFPTSFFLNAAYSEALFLALTTGAVWAALVRRDLLVAGIFAAFATATRNVAVFLLVPLVYELVSRQKENGCRARDVIGVALAPAGLVAYMGYLWARFGSPLQFMAAQGERPGWQRGLTDPLATVREAWEAAGPGWTYLIHPGRLFEGESAGPSFGLSNPVGFLSLALAVALVVVAVAVLPRALAAYGAALIAIPVLYPNPDLPLISLPRYMLAAFPLFIALGWVLARNRYVLATWVLCSAAAGGMLTALFTSWRWVA